MLGGWSEGEVFFRAMIASFRVSRVMWCCGAKRTKGFGSSGELVLDTGKEGRRLMSTGGFPFFLIFFDFWGWLFWLRNFRIFGASCARRLRVWEVSILGFRALKVAGFGF